MKVSTRAIAGVIAASALIAPLALATSAQAAPKAGKAEARIEAPRAAKPAEAPQPAKPAERPRAGKPAESRHEAPKSGSCDGHHDSDEDDAAPMVQLPA